jgi:hypothetical protein
MPKTVIEQVAALKDALRGVRTAVTYKKPKDLDQAIAMLYLALAIADEALENQAEAESA